MHIPNGFLNSNLSWGLIGAAIAVFSLCLEKVKETVSALVPQEAFATVSNTISNISSNGKRMLTKLGEQKLYLMGMIGTLIFSAQMFNFPIDKGTSGHLLGGMLAAYLLGPFAGSIVLAVVVAIQTFFYADGGILALGANAINMGAIGVFSAYYIYIFAKKYLPTTLAIAIGAWSSVILASSACAIEIALSKTIPLSQILPSMLKVHAIIGIGEALITIALIKIFQNMRAGNEDNL